MTGLEFVLATQLMTADVPSDYSGILNRLENPIEIILSECNGQKQTAAFLSTGESTVDIASALIGSEFSDQVGPGQVGLESHWEQKIFKRLSFPRHWETEGIERPNVAAKTHCLALIKKLFAEYQLIPSNILPSIEEGIGIRYDNSAAWEDRSMLIEVYNDLDIALIVTDNIGKETIYREDVREMNFNHAVEVYQNNRG